ncbi:MAG TPA: NAD(P)H-binding protein [Candidatus Limnocylindrales bacterium]
MSSAHRTVAVAGGTGLVGGAIARELASRGHHVVVLTRRPPVGGGQFEYRSADATRAEGLAAALAGIDTLVISLAFRNSPIEAPRRGQTFELVDAAGTERLVEAARSVGVKHLVYISGAGAAPNAAKHWFRAKWRAEEAIRGSGIAYTILRPSWIYGPGDHSLNRFVGFSGWLPFIPQIGNGKQLLAPVYVGDVAALVADSLDTPAAENVTLDVGGPDTLSMDEIIRVALGVLGRRRPILHTPVFLMKMITTPLMLLPTPPMTPGAIDFIVQSAQVDTAPLREILPRQLTPLRAALETYLGLGARAAT